MQWRGRRESKNVEDRRSLATTGLAVGGAGGIIALIVALLLGVDPRQILGPGEQPGPQVNKPEEDEQVKFVGVVLADTEDVWKKLFREELGRQYREPKLELFRGQVRSACGLASSAVGPFYCPEDEKVYLDLGFFKELSERLGARGEFARAYVIAHEVGHHVQNQLGYMKQVHSLPDRVGKERKNQASVRLELQADFLAGVWAHHLQKTKNVLEAGDRESALNAAFRIGDDALQEQAQGYVRPDSFTHGTSKQRMRWFLRGFEKGDLSERDLLFKLPYDQL